MIAARFLGNSRIELEERRVPEPAAEEVLVQVHCCALCGTDRSAYLEGSSVTPGHEIAGRVVATGKSVHHLSPNTPGVVYLVDYCGRCYACRSGATNMCLDRNGMYGFTADGGFATHVSVRAGCFLPIGGQVPLAAAPALLDLFGTPKHAFRRAGLAAPRSVAVLGCGPIGLGAVAVARSLGTSEIVAVDVSRDRLELVEALGAIPIDAGAGDVVEAVLRRHPSGFEVVIEAAGLTLTQRQAIALAAPGGRVVLVAHNHDSLEVSTLHELIRFEKMLLGSEYFPISEFAETLELLRSGGLDPAPLLTHRYGLDAIEEAFALFMEGKGGKVLVHP